MRPGAIGVILGTINAGEGIQIRAVPRQEMRHEVALSARVGCDLSLQQRARGRFGCRAAMRFRRFIPGEVRRLGLGLWLWLLLGDGGGFGTDSGLGRGQRHSRSRSGGNGKAGCVGFAATFVADAEKSMLSCSEGSAGVETSVIAAPCGVDAGLG